MTEQKEQFQSSNICWICKNSFDDEKVRDHCHITRVAAHWSCNIKSSIN